MQQWVDKKKKISTIHLLNSKGHNYSAGETQTKGNHGCTSASDSPSFTGDQLYISQSVDMFTFIFFG